MPEGSRRWLRRGGQRPVWHEVWGCGMALNLKPFSTATVGSTSLQQKNRLNFQSFWLIRRNPILK